MRREQELRDMADNLAAADCPAASTFAAAELADRVEVDEFNASTGQAQS